MFNKIRDKSNYKLMKLKHGNTSIVSIIIMCALKHETWKIQ